MGEQATFNRWVLGSKPRGGTNDEMARPHPKMRAGHSNFSFIDKTHSQVNPLDLPEPCNRQQKGHSIILHLILGCFILWINVIYISVSPNHFWHA